MNPIPRDNFEDFVTFNFRANKKGILSSLDMFTFLQSGLLSNYY